ncbi:hypothetical protein [Bosea sp. TND4EK4]|uniref:hypothetical protein n=1 Tax=Bosea sp. TND4EK4 TaxID=1907408 RepID=UPI000955F1BC|nr:hypothetical protein [Bosea sp. TND4EK4]SIP95304.1 hypothetical protein SAMN05880592_101308 [Bosea sp. TND4EK4]
MVSSEYQKIWRLMGILESHFGEFGERALADILGQDVGRLVRGYLGFLTSEKVIARTGDGLAARYRIMSSGDAPPHRRGHVSGGERQHAIWNSIRSLRTFSIAELAVTSATDEVPVSQDGALDYVSGLVRAGYVRASGTVHRSRVRLYSLIPARNTGPRAPILARGSSISFDLNLMRSVNLNGSQVDARAA